MKYKRDKKYIESIPEEWRAVPLGTMCEVTNQTGHRVRVTYFGPIADGRARTDIGLFPIADLTPIAQWEPKEGEVVAAWDDVQRGDDPVMIAPLICGKKVRLYRDPAATYTNIARIPEDFKLTPETITVAWWIANGELYEADHE